MKYSLFFALPLLAGTLAAAPVELQQEIAAGISSGKKEIVLTQPEYRSGRTVELKKLDGVTIDGNGARLVMTDLKHAVRLSNCRNVTVKNLTVDYDPLPFTQGVITSVSPDSRVVEFTIDKGYPDLTGPYAVGRMHLFTADRWEGVQTVCPEGDLAWVKKSDFRALPMWEGDRIFLDLLEADNPFFSLKLTYHGEFLTAAVLNGKKIR